MKKTEFISIRIDEDMKEKLNKLAAEEERTLSTIVYRILKKHLDQKENADTT